MSGLSKDQCMSFLRALKEAGHLDVMLDELSQSGAGPGPSTIGSMHDGAKRRLFSPSKSEDAEFEVIPPKTLFHSSFESKEGYQGPVTKKMPADNTGSASGLSLPPGISSVSEWGRTLCDMNKYKSQKWSYVDLVSNAKENTEVQEYLIWVTQNPNKSAKTKDLALYLEATQWQKKMPVMYFEGTNQVRRLQ